MRLVEDITNAQYAVVTCTEDHDFVDHEIISLRVSKDYGMSEINNQHAKVISHTSDSVTINIDSTNYTAFSIPGDLTGTTPPCIVPSSSGVDLTEYSPIMILEDAFDNRPDL